MTDQFGWPDDATGRLLVYGYPDGTYKVVENSLGSNTRYRLPQAEHELVKALALADAAGDAESHLAERARTYAYAAETAISARVAVFQVASEDFAVVAANLRVALAPQAPRRNSMDEKAELAVVETHPMEVAK